MLRSQITYFILAACLFTGAACHSSKKSHKTAQMPGVWQTTPIVIDGNSKDWPSPYPNYDSKGMVAYATSNDDKYLYITVESGDDLTQLKIVNSGMIVSIDTDGGKFPECNIHYPLPDVNGEPLDIPKAGKNDKIETLVIQMSKQLKKQIKHGMDDANQFTLDGFAQCNGGFTISQQTNCGIKVKASIDEYKELVWEAAIPFSAIYGREHITAADAGKPISVCFAIKGLKKPKPEGTDNTSSNMNSTGGMGGGRQGASGARGGGRSSIQDPMQQIYETTKTWKQFGLAFQ